MLKDIVLIDKEADWTSFDVVAKLRGVIKKDTGTKVKVGHAGTLDPFATGLLIVLVGDETKKQNEFMKLDKEYESTFVLGATSNTDDRTGEITIPSLSLRGVENDEAISLLQDRHASLAMTEEEVEEALQKFTGKIKQIPPKYSAIKVEGRRAYKLARKDEDFKIEPRTVTIYDLGIIEYDYPQLRLNIKCSSGTYIRALARDLGEALGCGAYVEDLRRTKIGKYDVSDAIKIEDIVEAK